MLIDFRVENHRSIREEQVLTMEASAKSNSASYARTVEGHRKPLVCVAAIYGANASGKTNVLAALGYMQAVVLNSQRFWDPVGGVPRDPFAWGEFRSKPSLYEVSFIQSLVRYRYGFVLDDNRIVEEWLYAWPHGRQQTWFERDSESMKFGDALKGENRIAEQITRDNSLFLSSSAQLKHPQLLEVYRWFRSMIVIGPNIPRINKGMRMPFLPVHYRDPSLRRLLSMASTAQQSLPFAGEDVGENERALTQYAAFLKAADVGIVDFKVDQDPERENRASLFLLHEAEDPNAWLPLREESEGTQTLLRLAQPVISALSRGKVLLVDELERSLHPLLARHVINQFNDMEKNPQHAQILFTTHDTNLLGTSVGHPALARAQVWLTEKTRHGYTSLYPLTDYKPRKQENLERGYLQGRYGGVPFLGDIQPGERESGTPKP